LCIQKQYGKIYAGNSKGDITIWNQSFECKKTVNIKVPIRVICFVDKHVLIGCGNGYIYALDKQDLSIVTSWNAHNGNKVNCLTIINNYVWSCGDDSKIKVWSLLPQECYSLQVDWAYHDRCITTLCCIEQIIWSCGRDSSIALWDKEYKLVSHLITPHTDTIQILCQVNEVMLSGGFDKRICLWNHSGLCEWELYLNKIFKQSCIAKNFIGQYFAQDSVDVNWNGILLSLKFEILQKILEYALDSNLRILALYF